ncbi:hypothetical protein BC567DRAFT_2891 [Phyllosticta citribraziliensis]
MRVKTCQTRPTRRLGINQRANAQFIHRNKLRLRSINSPSTDLPTCSTHVLAHAGPPFAEETQKSRPFDRTRRARPACICIKGKGASPRVSRVLHKQRGGLVGWEAGRLGVAAVICKSQTRGSKRSVETWTMFDLHAWKSRRKRNEGRDATKRREIAWRSGGLSELSLFLRGRAQLAGMAAPGIASRTSCHG